MKKLKKGCFFYLVASFILMMVFLIVDHFTPETEQAKRTIEVNASDMQEAESLEELHELKAEVDTVEKNYPEHASLVDSLITDSIHVWEQRLRKEEADQRRYSAYVFSKELVKQNLKSPSTAEFASYVKDEAKVWREGNVYYCDFWVDAKNAFNATLRTNWQVKLRYVNDKFKVVDVAEY